MNAAAAASAMPSSKPLAVVQSMCSKMQDVLCLITTQNQTCADMVQTAVQFGLPIPTSETEAQKMCASAPKSPNISGTLPRITCPAPKTSTRPPKTTPPKTT
eukprot:CAMPEP_0172698018 /NCGR_PEP_ID=MMETSP1074-20121228/29159_1 /TAXON_ID=2916 /ORGANISM="Ceratium fusus, Strain PA161109" /LENGTH=101 /DNA_ID=CAMNT_0013518989 /DNA_START=62 /DNA_END=364 /DNA_ORIENTATION=+